MLEIIKKHPRYFFGAVLVHVFFLILFGVGFHLHSERRAASTQPQTVKVTTVDEKQVQKELKSLEASDDRERKRSEQLRRQRETEEKKLAAARAKRIAEQEQEKLRQAEVVKKQKALALKRKAEEVARKQREEEERRQRAQREKALKQQLAAEEKRMQAEQQVAAAQRRAAQKARQTEIDKYMNLIENRIYQNWVKPPNIDKGLKCVLEVQLIPTGEVINIQLSKPSGDPVYDQSVIAAVRRASPLPVPSAASGLFDDFRNLTLPVQADKKI